MTVSSMRRRATHRLGLMEVVLAAVVILLLSVSARTRRRRRAYSPATRSTGTAAR